MADTTFRTVLPATKAVDLGDGTYALATVPMLDRSGVACAAADVNAPAANTAAVVTYAATPALKHCISGIAWSYSTGLPVGGNIIIQDAGVTVFNLDITEDGERAIEFPRPKKSALVNTAMVIILAAGGVGITGKLSVISHWLEV